ncbi:MAG: hypothetical protein ALAOOOJD_01933 [bacterium]|nr:hypothetical protein [bacterium]
MEELILNIPDTLEVALDVIAMCAVFAFIVQGRFGASTQLRNLTADYLQRRIVRYVAQIFNPEKERAAEWRMIGKVYNTPEQMQRSFNMMRALWANGFSRSAVDGICIPEPFQMWPELRLLLMEEVPGVRLRHLIKDMQAGREHMRLLAQAAAKLHQCPLTPDAPLQVEQLLALCKPRPQRLAQKFPALAAPIQYLIEAAPRLEQQFARDLCRPVHGDFHLAHVLLENEKCWIIDLDELSHGDPAIDLAEIFVFFKRTAQKKKMADYVEMLRNEFMAHYGAAMGWEIIGRVPLYESLLNLKRACKCFRVQDESGWEEKMQRLVEQAVACMQVMELDAGKLDFAKSIERYERCPGTV